jgi:hypothetical protein
VEVGVYLGGYVEEDMFSCLFCVCVCEREGGREGYLEGYIEEDITCFPAYSFLLSLNKLETL